MKDIESYFSYFYYRPLNYGKCQYWRLKWYIMRILMTLSIHCYKFHFPRYSMWYRFLYNLTSLCSIQYPLSLSFFVVYYRITKLFTPSIPLASLLSYLTPPTPSSHHSSIRALPFVFLLSPKISYILHLLSHLLFGINGGVKMYKGGAKRDYFRWKEMEKQKV